MTKASHLALAVAPPTPLRLPDPATLLARVPGLAERIAIGAAQRDIERELPFEAFRLFRESGLGALRLPSSWGRPGGSVADVIELIATRARADSNVAHALRPHFGTPRPGIITTRVRRDIKGVRLDGRKHYAAKLKAAGYNLVNARYVGTAASLFVNTSRPVVRDVEVRRALREGINTQEIVELVQNGYVDAATGLLTPSTPGFIDQTKQLPYDLEAAKQRLDKAGWKPGADGIRVKDGQPLKISGAFFSNAINRALFEVIQQQVRELGVDFVVRPIPSSAEHLQGQIRRDYDVYRWHWSLADADVLRKDFSSAGINRLRLPPENDIDALLVKQAGTTDPVERRKITDEVQKIILDRGYGIPLFNPDNLWAANVKVKDLAFGPSGTGGPHEILYDTWISH